MLPKPLYILATAQPPRPLSASGPTKEEGEGDDSPPGLAYSLRTRLSEPGVEDELSRVFRCKNQKEGGESLVSVGRIVDGVVAFEVRRVSCTPLHCTAGL